jgi:hypothetical protein
MKVINLFGGPGTGKSTTAAGVFHHMKCAGLEVELVTEYAKDMVWEHRHNILEDQIYIFAKQQRRISRLRDHHIDWVITDSPIPLGLCYRSTTDNQDAFAQVVMQVFNSYENHNFYLTRNVQYNPNGRNQKQVHEAEHVDDKVMHMLTQNQITCDLIQGGTNAVKDILACLQLVN